MKNDPTQYIGDELELFEKAVHWKAYFRSQIMPFLKGRVLEVGAGLGGTTSVLYTPECSEWVCLEPDPQLSQQIQKKIDKGILGSRCKVHTGVLADLDPNEKFDTILYIDVLEHIEDDHAEAQLAISHLSPSGKVVVLSPAHNYLYSPFDKAIGHYRRYNKVMLRQVFQGSVKEIKLIYLDSLGMILSLVNRILLKSTSPKPSQIAFWDTQVVPVSKVLDKLLRYNLGKSVIGVWEQTEQSR
jgi:SAM-dependent methyltransferase